jgi:hypothetical protein
MDELVFEGYTVGSSLFCWITLLVLFQATIWSLAGFPFVRTLALCVIGYCFVGYPTLSPENFLRQNQPWVLSTLLVGGSALAHIGLAKIRRGEWQRWRWRFPWLGVFEAKAPKEFHSAAEAQLWLNWRNYGRTLFLAILVITWVPIILLAPEVMLNGRLDVEGTQQLCLYVLAIPLVIHLFHGIDRDRSLFPFVVLHPLTNGDIVIGTLKTLGRSTVLSWTVTAAALCTVPLLGDVVGAFGQIKSFAQDSRWILLTPVMLLGLIFLTWRFSVVNLGIAMSGKSKVAHLPGLAIPGYALTFGALAYLEHHPEYRETSFRILVAVLSVLLLLKLILAKWAFGLAIRRHLLDRTAATRYLVLWAALGVFFVAPFIIVFRDERGVLPLSMFIVLLLPLARIGFAPIALAMGRHR